MLQHTYYTAVGHYLCKTDEAGRTYPVVICHQKEYSVDLQEMTLWTALNWRLLDRRQAEQQYQKLARDLIPTPPRSSKWFMAWLSSSSLRMRISCRTALSA